MYERTGLTLIEVLIALVIIAVAFMVLASTQITSIQVTRDSNLASISTQVGNAAMERASKALLANGWACDDDTFPCSGTFEDIQVEGRSHEAEYDIFVPAESSNENLAGVAQVDITVAEPTELSLSQYVSCMDVVDAPSYKNPSPCPDPSSDPPQDDEDDGGSK